MPPYYNTKTIYPEYPEEHCTEEHCTYTGQIYAITGICENRDTWQFLLCVDVKMPVRLHYLDVTKAILQAGLDRARVRDEGEYLVKYSHFIRKFTVVRSQLTIVET